MMKYCGYCGKTLNDDVVFCTGCGKRCRDEVKASAVLQEQPQQDWPSAAGKKPASGKKVLPLWVLLGLSIIVAMVAAVMGFSALLQDEEKLPGQILQWGETVPEETNQSMSAEVSEPEPEMTEPPATTVPPATEPVREEKDIIEVATGTTHIVALRADGTVSVVVEKGWERGQDHTAGWQDITAVAAGYYHTVGLKSDGTVVAVGMNEHGQCNVSGWTDIVAVSASNAYTVGLKSDGTVVATGLNDCGQCDVSELKNIARIYAAKSSLHCLDTEGNWILLGYDSQHPNNGKNLGIVDIGAARQHAVGLTTQGKAIFLIKKWDLDISQWSDLTSVKATSVCVVGLKSDGTVVAVGNNTYGECEVSDWTDIVAIYAGWSYTVGLKRDGTVVVAGRYVNSEKPCDVSALNRDVT